MQRTDEKSDLFMVDVKLRLAVVDLDYLVSILKGASLLDSEPEGSQNAPGGSQSNAGEVGGVITITKLNRQCKGD